MANAFEYLSAELAANGWVYQTFAVVLLTLLTAFIAKRILLRVQRSLEKTKTPWDEAVVDALRRPLGVLIWAVGLAFAVDIVRGETASPVLDAVSPVRDVAVIACIAWFLVRFSQRAELNILEKGQLGDHPIDRTTLDAVMKLLRVSVVITAALVVLQTLGFSVSGVLAFGGIGGIAVGFAAKDLLANFFGGLMIYLDRPFAVGEWVRSPDRELEGTVEEIGWRLTRIRTFDMRPRYVPNSVFTTIAVENPSRMTHRRIFETVSVRYEDIPAIPKIVSDVKSMLETHPEVAHDQLLMVNFNEYAESSADFFVYTFTRTTNWARFHDVKQDVLLKISTIVTDNGAQIAVPARDVRVQRGDEGLQR